MKMTQSEHDPGAGLQVAKANRSEVATAHQRDQQKEVETGVVVRMMIGTKVFLLEETEVDLGIEADLLEDVELSTTQVAIEVLIDTVNGMIDREDQTALEGKGPPIARKDIEAEALVWSIIGNLQIDVETVEVR